MRVFLKRVLTQTILRTKSTNNSSSKKYSDYQLAKAYRILLILIKRAWKDFFLITIGIFSAAFGFKGFLLTNNFIDGGATGISLLISAVTEIPLPLLIIVVNIPFVLMGYKIVSTKFAIKTALAIAGLALVLATVTFPNVTNDNLLVAVFWRIFF